MVAAVTRSERAPIVIEGDSASRSPPSRSTALVDTTGAGDLYASGFLAGLAHGKDHAGCARLGALAAAEVIQHVGARPLTNLRELADEHHLFG